MSMAKGNSKAVEASKKPRAGKKAKEPENAKRSKAAKTPKTARANKKAGDSKAAGKPRASRLSDAAITGVIPPSRATETATGPEPVADRRGPALEAVEASTAAGAESAGADFERNEPQAMDVPQPSGRVARETRVQGDHFPGGRRPLSVPRHDVPEARRGSYADRAGGLGLPPVLQANVFDTRGGAARIAWQLHQAYLAAGIDAFMAVGVKFSRDERVLALANDSRRGPWAGPLRRLERGLIRRRVRLLPGLARGLSYLAEPERFFDARAGREDFNYPATRELPSLPPRKPGVLHAHVLHSGWFDLRELPALSRTLPTVVTMHDEWLVTGHCAYAMDCERFRFGCGRCPDLGSYPPARADATAFNWKRKRGILNQSRLHVAAPSRWLLDRLLQAYPPWAPRARVVRNGIDLSVFRPVERREKRQEARASLGLAAEDKVVLYMAHGGRDNARKGFDTARLAFLRAAARGDRAARHVLLCLGGDVTEERGESWAIRSAGFVSDMTLVARYYQAADVFLHAALQDNYPNTVLEAQACGAPVVATAVGGVPEQVDDGLGGHLVPVGDVEAMAASLGGLLRDEGRRRAMGESAARAARERHGLERMAREYLDWYAELLDEFARGQDRP